MTKINPTTVFVQPKKLVNPLDLREGLGWFTRGIATHVRGEKLDSEVLDEVRDVVFALRRSGIAVSDPMHEVEREYPHETRAFSFLHPYGFKITLLEDFGVDDRIIINDDIGNPLTIGTMYK